MKRIHIGLEVSDIEASVKFYSTLFGAEPTRREADYAKWMLDDPRVNFAIQTHGRESAGSVHFGIQVHEAEALEEYAGRLEAAGESVLAEPGAQCCYYESDKYWVRDPDAMRWETFHTVGEITEYGENLGLEEGGEGVGPAASCCAQPREPKAEPCCAGSVSATR